MIKIMTNIKQLILTLVALFAMTAGAWAQSSLNVVEFEVPAEWQNNESAFTAADLPGFKAVTLDEAQTWTGAPASGKALLVYAFDGKNVCVVPFNDGVAGYGTNDAYLKGSIYNFAASYKFFITTEPTEWELKPDADKKVWTLDKMPAGNVELQVEYEPTKVTMAANDNTMGTVEVAGESKVEWTADTWKGWTADTKVYTVDDITMTSSQSGHIREYISEDQYNNSLFFFVRSMVDDATVTFSTTGDPFSRIEFTMIGDYSQYNPNIIPNDNWTFEGKSAVWEGEATKSLTLQSCSTNVSKITFFKGAAIPDGVTVNGDGTFTVAKTATVTLTATPAEGYKFLYWEDDQTNTNPVREVTIESGMADMTYKAVFAEILYNVTFADGIEDADKWSATPNTNVKKDTKVDVKYTGSKKVLGVKAEKKAPAKPLANATTEDLGKVVGADGNIYANKAAAEAVATGNAVAMIAYVGTASDCAHGLAIALADESGTKDYGAAGTACSGKAAVTGGTWRLPSIKDWQYMFIGCGASGSYSDNPSSMSYSGLASKLTTAQGDAMQPGYYWSSTEYLPGTDAWSVCFDGSSNAIFGFDSESNDSPRVRACLAF